MLTVKLNLIYSHEFSDRNHGIIKAYTMAYQSRMNKFKTGTVCHSILIDFGDTDFYYIFNVSILTAVQTVTEIIFPNSA